MYRDEYRDDFDRYGEFASVYERMMANVPYDDWVKRMGDIMREAGIIEGLVLDLGCGTGTITRRLEKLGYDMIGIDISESMLQRAWEQEMKPLDPFAELRAQGKIKGKKKEEKKSEILYLQQDMRTFELFGTVRCIVCACDSINYILSKEEVEMVFRLVNNYLDPDGVFIVDFHTPSYFKEVLRNKTITELESDMVLIWENEETEEGNHESYLTFFREERDGRYTRFDEAHVQRGYTIRDMLEAAANSGLVDIRFFDGYTKQPAKESSERIVMTAREYGKSAVRRAVMEEARKLMLPSPDQAEKKKQNNKGSE